MSTYLNNDRLIAVLIGGCLLILAGLVCALIIKEEQKEA
jgi:maltose/moltooligosaccharide transporter